MVVNVKATVVSDTSVEVSWERVNTSNIIGYSVLGYAVYYHLVGNRSDEVHLTVNGSANSKIIVKNLIHNREYKFQVAVLAKFEGGISSGERSWIIEKLILHQGKLNTVIIKNNDHVLCSIRGGWSCSACSCGCHFSHHIGTSSALLGKVRCYAVAPRL